MSTMMLRLVLLTLAAAATPAPCCAFTQIPTYTLTAQRRKAASKTAVPSTADAGSASSSPEASPAAPQQQDDVTSDEIFDATTKLANFDSSQQAYIVTDGSRGMGGGTSALAYLKTLSPSDRASMRDAVQILVSRAHVERADDSSKGRIMLGFCAENAPEALGGLKTWVTSVGLPRGMLHGMDVDGVPLDPVELGSVYVKYSTGGAMSFREMRKSGLGFDALWRPGDALLEPYDGDFRGVYLNVELSDDVFRQFGVLPTDLFMEEEEW